MLTFCPYDGSLLTVGQKGSGNRLECRACPYIYPITHPMYSRTYFERKAKEDEIGPTDWSNAAKAQVQCPKDGCDGNEAAFFQVQIRSADEPMTTFYKCMDCGGRWRD
ncbi:probable DNA-directed RNA polymerase III subunit C11 [Cephalotrichum gorgonifer]|uniref:DNA-directed RNA polymerase subunit n=1 Tax=Cephalotrichum gorgonifer TaxID=2041049 RepID=A0AAE8N1N0_9PEZI|nr:probable DNA-directed RNA polymerase III subunit C11 [Cephalotrichum gorgonifer]